ncbi:MAG: glycosyltransferase family 1 protein [Cyanobacteria bacterium P01_A01_bin.17]
MHVLIPALHRPVKPTGVCRHAANLAQCLADTEQVSQVTVLIGAWQQAYFEASFNLQSPKISLVTVDIKNTSLSRNRWFVVGLPELVRQIKPDLLHLSFPFPFIRQWFEVPIVSSIHDLYPYECPENFGYPQVWFNRGFLKQCVQGSDGLACVSQVTLQSLNAFFPNRSEQQRTVVYNYVDFSDIKIKAPQKLADGAVSNFILCVAQHRKNKNLDLLIQAYTALLKKQAIAEDVQLILVGSAGPETDALHDLIQSLALQDKVIFLSALTDEELCWLYQACSLFVIPSSTEGFCLPLVEALSWGCKVVCSDIPIFREVGSEGCAYFPLNDDAVVELRDAIATSLMSHPPDLLSKTQAFSKQNTAQTLLELYTSVR